MPLNALLMDTPGLLKLYVMFRHNYIFEKEKMYLLIIYKSN